MFGFTTLLFMPVGFLIGGLSGNDTIGFVFGGAIEDTIAGVVMSLIIAAVYKRRDRRK
jgi:membrane associated rhomboid family serine protease